MWSASQAARMVTLSRMGNGIVTLLGVGGGAAAAVLLLALIVRGAIVTAVREAGKQERARLQADLAQGLAHTRQQFEADLERVRQRAARDLEIFKTELQLAAEVRRQVATKKVAALVSIGTAGEALLRDVLSVRPNGRDDRAAAMGKVHAFGELVRSNSFLFEKVIADRFHQYGADLVKAEVELNIKLDETALGRAMSATETFLQVARAELGVSSAASGSPIPATGSSPP
jgi:hypothetical protein